MRSERGSVDVVASRSRFERLETRKGKVRVIGLDIHRAFAEAVAWDEGKLKRLGRDSMRREELSPFAPRRTRACLTAHPDRHNSPVPTGMQGLEPGTQRQV